MNSINHTELEMKYRTFEAIGKLSEFRQREALVELKTLLLADYPWEFIATAFSDP